MRGQKGSLAVTTLVVAAQLASCLTATQSPAANVTPQALTSTAKDTTVAPQTEPPSTGKAPLESSLPGKVPLEPPSSVKAPLEVPSSSKTPLEVPSSSKAPLEVASTSKAPLEVPSTSKSPLEVPTTSQSPLEVPSTSKAPLEVPSSSSKSPPESTVKTPPETSPTGKPPSEPSYVETAKERTAGASTRNAAPSTTEEQTTTTTTTTTTAREQYSTEWQDIEEEESERLLDFVVSEIQKLKVEHRELDECQELDLSSVLSGKKLSGKTVKYSITLKVQPQVKNTAECLQQNSTNTNNMHPEICEADVTEGDRGGTNERTLLRSTCLQVEELQD